MVLGFGHCASLQQDGWEIGVSYLFFSFLGGRLSVIFFILGFSQFLSYGVVFSIWPESSRVILDIFIRGTFQTALWRFPLQLIIQLLDEDIT